MHCEHVLERKLLSERDNATTLRNCLINALRAICTVEVEGLVILDMKSIK